MTDKDKGKELPDINLEAAEIEYSQHLDKECLDDCPWCLDKDAADPLLVQHRRVFDRLFREKSKCSRCGERIDSDLGCRDPQCPGGKGNE